MPRILLIDDDEHLGAPLASYFARFDCVLDSVTRPSEGLARLRAEHYDAAILDVMLPEMDGFALCREIRKESEIPIVMLTARGEVMDRVVGLELGADDYLRSSNCWPCWQTRPAGSGAATTSSTACAAMKPTCTPVRWTSS